MPETYKPCPHQIISIELLKSKNTEDANKIINDKAKPGYFEADVAANVLLAHSMNKLTLAIEKLSHGSNSSNNGSNGQ